MDRDQGGEPPTGLVCPNGSGGVSVHIEGGRRTVLCRCRAGHAYGLTDFLISKEETIEATLWRALCALDEFADLLLPVTEPVDGEPMAGPTMR